MGDKGYPPIVQHGPMGYDDTKNVYGVPSVSGHATPKGGTIDLGKGSNNGGGSWGGKDSEDEEDSAGLPSGGFGGFNILGFEKVGIILDALTSGEFWKRLGIGALGFVIIVIALGFIITSTNTGKRVAKTAAGAAVGGPAGAAVGASS